MKICRISMIVLTTFVTALLFSSLAYGDELLSAGEGNTNQYVEDGFIDLSEPSVERDIESDNNVNPREPFDEQVPTLPLDSELSLITSNEKDIVTALMQERALQPPQNFAILYNHNAVPKFLMGWSNDGYLIVDRDSWCVLESGEGYHPFTGYENSKKYYGGALCVYIETNEGFLDLLSGRILTEIGYSVAVDELGTIKSSPPTLTPYSVRTANEKSLSSCMPNLQRLAFGNNTSNTCSAVAVGIALNYFDHTVSNSFVPNDMESETLNGTAIGQYRNAERLHSYLVNNCDMAGPNYGQATCRGVANYCEKAPGASSTHLSLSSFLTTSVDASAFIREQIDKGRPALLTTTYIFDNVSEVNYNWHTMVAYGYRTTSDGSFEVCLHTGWSNAQYFAGTGNNRYAKKTWLPASIASYVYRFSYTLTGWHSTPSGNKYYSSNGTEVQPVSIDRLAGVDVHETAGQIASAARTSASSVVVVSGAPTSWQDAVSAAGFAGMVNGPILTTEKDYLPLATANAIQRLGAKHVYIVGGSAVVSENVKSQLASIVGVNSVNRYYGEDGYATAEAVYRAFSSSWLHPTSGYSNPKYSSTHTWKNGSRKRAVIITSGEISDDAATAASLSAYTHAPVLLAKHNGTLTEASKNILRNGNFDEVYCVGGTVKKAASVACALVDPADIVGGEKIDRPNEYFGVGENWYYAIYGTTAYDTSEKAFYYTLLEGASPNRIAICSGQNRTDSYAASSLRIPLLLADSTSRSNAQSVIKKYANRINTISVCGGTSVVADVVVNDLVDSWWYGKVGSVMRGSLMETSFFINEGNEESATYDSDDAQGVVAEEPSEDQLENADPEDLISCIPEPQS